MLAASFLTESVRIDQSDFDRKPAFYRRAAQTSPVFVEGGAEPETVMLNSNSFGELMKIIEAYHAVFGDASPSMDRQAFLVEHLPFELADLLLNQPTPDLEDYDY